MPAPDGTEPQFLSSDDFHPEFGYLWPSPRKLRRIRRVALWTSAGTVIGAIVLLVLLPHAGGGRSGRFVSAAAAAVVAPAVEASAAPIAVTDASGAASCQDLLGSFIDRQCQSSRLRKSRSGRRASARVVSLPIGRGASANRDEGSAPDVVTRVQDAAVSQPAVAAAPDPAVSETKPRAKTARKHKPSFPDDGRSAYAAVPTYGRDAYGRGPYAAAPRLPPYGYGGGGFGRSW